MEKKNKKIIYVLFGIGILMLFSGCFSNFINGLRADHEKVNERMKIVDTDYQELTNNINTFTETRDNLYFKYLEKVDYTTFYNDNNTINSSISNYESLVDEITKKVKSLDNLCKDTYFSSTDTNEKCSNYKLLYEQVNNYFVSDINKYNNIVKDYNMNNVNNVSVYNISRKYIDYNKDKTYDGKKV